MSRRSLNFGLRLALVLLPWTVACGRGGGGDRNPAVNPNHRTDETNAALTRETSVAVDPMGYRLPPLATCHESTAIRGLPSLKHLALDGDLAEWSSVPKLLDDPQNDAPRGFDLSQGQVVSQGDDLGVAVVTSGSLRGELLIELGGVVAHKSQLDSDVRHLFRFDGRHLFEGDGDASPLPTTAWGAAIQDEALELTLSHRLVADVVSWPLWWIRLVTLDHGVPVDATSAAYFPSVLDQDPAPFGVEVCHGWTGRTSTLSLVQITQAGIDREILEQAFQLTRLGLDGFGAIWKSPFPNTTWPLIGTFGQKINGSLEYLSGASYLGQSLQTQSLDPDSGDDFPAGQILGDVVRRIAGHALAAANPRVPALLQIAWREALVDSVMRSLVGDAYWFDHYGADVEPFLIAPDTPRPLPLAVSATGPEGLAKASGFGHLLSTRWSGKVLTKAWILAASPCRRGDCEPAGRLAWALGEVAGKKGNAGPFIQSVWPGWVENGSYRAPWTPNILGDSDSDGVPDFVELFGDTDPEEADSDYDGWSDLAELVAKTDPLGAKENPVALMPDQNFGDWQTLLPRRLGIDRTHSGQCPKAADIEYFGAVVTPDQLIIGAVAAEFWEGDSRARWLAELDFPGVGRHRTLAGRSGQRTLTLMTEGNGDVLRTFHRGAAVAQRAIEWAVPRAALAIDDPWDVEGAVRIKLRTAYQPAKSGEEVFCDETSWIEPLLRH